MQGWLQKQRHGLYKPFLRRFFVLDGRELRYYKNDTDHSPQNVVDLLHYRVEAISRRSSQPQTMFRLVSDNNTVDQPHFLLQAATEQDMQTWVTALHQQIAGATHVLEKWLERFDVHTPTSEHTQSRTSVTSLFSSNGSLTSSSPTSVETEDRSFSKPPRLVSFISSFWPRRKQTAKA
ncbi:Rho GTPase-activating protein 22 [Apophysomyces sp. BC1015]|nr:Rho GTPase-activating protein 22 [Apophysomyces sp. BC1015]